MIFKPKSICKGDKRGMDEEMEKGKDIWCRPSLSRTKDRAYFCSSNISNL